MSKIKYLIKRLLYEIIYKITGVMNLKIVVIDGQGGRMGKMLVENKTNSS